MYPDILTYNFNRNTPMNSKPTMNAIHRISAVTVLLLTPTLAVPPIPITDSFADVYEDIQYFAPVPGVLGNDDFAGHPAIEAIGVTQPTHGTVTVNANGSFVYTPTNLNYSGPDSFTYKARRAVPPMQFAVDEVQSANTVTITVNYDQDGSEGATPPVMVSDTAITRLDGTVSVGLLNPRAASGPFNRINVTGSHIILKDRMDWDMGAEGVGNVHINSWPEGDPAIDHLNSTLAMPRAAGPGASPPVNVDPSTGRFAQLNNKAGLTGDFFYDYVITGVESGTGTLHLVDSEFIVDYTNELLDSPRSNIQSDGTTLTLTLKFKSTYTAIVQGTPGNTSTYTFATIVSDGTIVATFTPASENIAEESAPATVNLTINPVNDAPVGVADSYFTRQGARLTVGANPSQTTETFITTGPTASALSKWDYLYDGTNPGTTWKEWYFTAAAPWQLSKETPIGWSTTGHPTGNNLRPNLFANNNYQTVFLRKDFTVNNSLNTAGNATLSLIRQHGAAVYLNGTEIYRDANLPENAAYNTYATSSSTATPINIPIAPEFIWEGRNVLAVEVHETSTASSLEFNAGLTRTVGVKGLLVNDTDIDSTVPGELTASLLMQPANGTATVNTDGSFTYEPAPGFTGTDSFTYRVGDEDSHGSIATLIATGSTWKYLADGSDQGTAWRESAFNDTAWPSGRAELGYGDGPEATNIQNGNPI